jgi:hypothetical protein
VCVWPGGGPGGKYGAISSWCDVRVVLSLGEERPPRSQWSRVVLGVLGPLSETLKSSMKTT